MTHCYICDKDTDTCQYDRYEGSFGPCAECQEVINDCLQGYDDVPEDDLEPVPEEFETPIFVSFDEFKVEVDDDEEG